jgi:hypothetical protein
VDGLLSLFDIHYSTQLYAFSNFSSTRFPLSVPLGREVRFAWKVEPEFGRTLKLERVYLRME